MRTATASTVIDIDKEKLLDAYRIMRTIREFEDRLHLEFATGEIPGLPHGYVGAEAIAAGILLQTNDDDFVFSTHRPNGHAIAKGCDIKAMMLELYGKKDGLCGGKGGSMHLADLQRGFMGANGIVGASCPLTCGAALSAKVRGTTQVAVGFLGDGAANQGTFFEAMNLAAIWKLPCVFVVEHNRYAQSTGATYHMSVADAARRADGFDIPGIVVDGRDFFAVYETAGEAIRRAREGEGPTVVECKVDLFCGHYEGDTEGYRAANEGAILRATRDPLDQFARDVTGSGLVDSGELAAIDEDVLTLVDEAVAAAKAAPEPDETDLLTDVYVSY